MIHDEIWRKILNYSSNWLKWNFEFTGSKMNWSLCFLVISFFFVICIFLHSNWTQSFEIAFQIIPKHLLPCCWKLFPNPMQRTYALMCKYGWEVSTERAEDRHWLTALSSIYILYKHRKNTSHFICRLHTAFQLLFSTLYTIYFELRHSLECNHNIMKSLCC